MANEQIPNLPVATSLSGAEELEIVQSGTSVRTTTGAVAAIASAGTYTGSPIDIPHGGTAATTAQGAFDNLSPIRAEGDLIIGNATGNAVRLPVGTAGQALTSTGTTVQWTSLAGTGTVTSVNVSGGTTGLTTTGGPITGAGTITIGGLLDVANGGTGVTTSTGTGSVVLSTNPVLVTPNLGTPSAATLTNATGLPIDAGTTGLLPVSRGGTGANLSTTGGTSQVLKQTTLGGAVSVAQLSATDLVNGTTGSGAVALATSPTLVTPNLGTPSAVTLTNATGLPLTTGVTGALPIANGGTGQTTKSTAFDALSPITNQGDLIVGDATGNAVRLATGGINQVLMSDGAKPYWSSNYSNLITVNDFSGNGTTTAFTMTVDPHGADNTQVYINGIYQEKNTYTVSGTTLTFGSAPPAGTNNIEVVITSTVGIGTTSANAVVYTPESIAAPTTDVQTALRLLQKQNKYFPTIAAMLADTTLLNGDVCYVAVGTLGKPEEFQIDPFASYASSASPLVQATAVVDGTGHLWAVSLRTEYANYAEFDADPRKLTSGQYTIPSIGASGTFVSSGQNLTTTAGTKVVVDKTEIGYVVSHFGASGTTAAKDTAAAQACVNACLAANSDMQVDVLCLVDPATMIAIDRQVDGAAYDRYFNIIGNGGGGFVLSSAGAMFTSTIAFTTAPVSQLICFQNISFIGASGAQYVLNDGRFLRMQFTGCTFDKILCVNSSIYLQSYGFLANNYRRGVGNFFKSSTFTYDLNVSGGKAESWTGNFWDLEYAIGCRIDGLHEGISGKAVVYNGAHGLDLRLYCEANTIDIDGRGSSGTGTNPAYGVNIHGSCFAPSNLTAYSIFWGTGGQIACISEGNYHSGYMHSFPASGLDVLVRDAAAGSLYDKEPNPSFSSTLTLNDGALGGGYGGTIKGYGVSAAGGFLGLGVLNNYVYTEGITIDQTGLVTFNNAAYVKGNTPLAGANELGLGATTATTATAGTAALPANPATFLQISIGGNYYKVPVYNV